MYKKECKFHKECPRRFTNCRFKHSEIRCKYGYKCKFYQKNKCRFNHSPYERIRSDKETRYLDDYNLHLSFKHYYTIYDDKNYFSIYILDDDEKDNLIYIWKEISGIENLSNEFLIQNSNTLDWSIVLNNRLSNIKYEEFCLFFDYFNNNNICDIFKNQNFRLSREELYDFFENHFEKLGLKNLICHFLSYQKIPCELIKRCFDKKSGMKIITDKRNFILDGFFQDISYYQILDIDFYKKYNELIDWRKLKEGPAINELPEETLSYIFKKITKLNCDFNEKFFHRKFSIDFIDKNKSFFRKEEWEYIVRRQNLTVEFIENNIDIMFFDFDILSMNENIDLDEKFLEKYQNKVNWNYIFGHKRNMFSKKFLLKFLKLADNNKIKNTIIRYTIGCMCDYNGTPLPEDICKIINRFYRMDNRLLLSYG